MTPDSGTAQKRSGAALKPGQSAGLTAGGADTGQLTAIGHTLTEPVPRAFNLDPQGRFLFASGLESGRLASYRIGAETGQLEPLDIYDIGQQPMWVLCVEL